MNEDVVIALHFITGALLKVESVISDVIEPNDTRLVKIRSDITAAGSAVFRLTQKLPPVQEVSED